MSDPTSIDLASSDHWRGVRPGMSKAEVLAALQQQGLDTSTYGGGLTASTDAWELAFTFSKDGAERLRQISIDGEEILWNGQSITSVPLDDAWRALGSPASAVWAANDAMDEPFPELGAGTPPPVTDEQLLEEGTLWIPERGLGLSMCEGEVFGVVWRAPQDLPKRFAGPLTSAQRELSKRPDLEEHLREKHRELFRAKEKKDPLTPVRTIITILTIATLAWIAKLGVDETRVWGQAQILQAKFIAEEQVPMKQFRDYLPPALRWLVPPSKPVIVEAYRVEYRAPEMELGEQVVLERGELYVPPEKPGDEVPVAYVSGNPPRVQGLSHARDSAFIQFIPWAIVVGALWLIANFALNFVPLLPSLVRCFAPRRTSGDPDRPELR